MDKDCPVLKLHEEAITDSVQEKYLRDIIHSSGRIQPTIEDRRVKGFADVTHPFIKPTDLQINLEAKSKPGGQNGLI